MRKESNLKVSLVLVTYCPNEERYGFCKRSFAEMPNTGIPRSDYELIVFNNGGIHQDLIETLDYDILLTADHNIGVGAGFNAGISVAIGDVLALMQDDLGYKEGWLAKGLEILDRYPDHVAGLIAVDEWDILEEADSETDCVKKVPMGHIMQCETFWKVGPYLSDRFNPGGLWIRFMLEKGIRFMVNKEPYLFHIGARKSIIGQDRTKIQEFRRRHD